MEHSQEVSLPEGADTSSTAATATTDKSNSPTRKKMTPKKKRRASDMNFCGTVGHMPTTARGYASATSVIPINRIAPSSAAKKDIKVAAAASQPPSDGNSPQSPPPDKVKCDHCDPTSSLQHIIKSTRIRIANLCCAGEESIIMNTLNHFKGIESVNINIIGRYAMVKHCPEECCASAVKMVEKLCEARLGASIQESSDGQDEEESGGPPVWKVVHGMFVSMVFAWAIIVDVHGRSASSFYIYLFNVIVGSIPILKKAVETVVLQRALNIQVLMIVAIAGAMGAGDFHDAAIVVTLFIIAELLEEYVLSVVRNTISNSARGLVKTATLVEDNRQVPVDSLVIGDRIAVCAGDMIPVDGDVSQGQGVVDESALTGEATPIAKLTGSKVVSGTVVQNGYLEVTVGVEPKDSTLRRMNQAVEEVQADRGRFATVVDRFAEYWTPAVLILAALFCVIGGGATGKWSVYLERTLVLLVLACPCAVVLAAPIACVCGIAGAAKQGVLIKGSSVIEKLGLIDVIAVDKTGTLTKGFFSLVESVSLVTADVAEERRRQRIPNHNALQLAAALEAKSAHPLANAIVAGYCGCIAEMSPDSLSNVDDVRVLDGLGLEGIATLEDGDLVRVCVGNERLFEINGGPCKMSEQQISLLDTFTEKYKSATVVVVAIEDRLELAIALGDTIRPESHIFCTSLNNLGCTVAMLTGDHRDVADMTCNILGITECEARLLPEGKHDWVKQKRDQGKYVMMLGDGINDTTALAASSVGVAMGAGGSAMAVSVADMVLMSENLLRIPAAIDLGRIVRAIILENIAFSVGMKIVAVILALSGKLDLWHAILFDIGSLFAVIANGIRPLYCEKLFEKYSANSTDSSKKGGEDVESQNNQLLASEISPFKEHSLPRASVRSKANFIGHNVDGFRTSSFSSLLITEETGVVEIIAERESQARGLTGAHYERPYRSTFNVELP